MMNRILRILNESNRCTVLTGAGVSTLSGIRDFRGKNGLNKEFRGEMIFDIDLFYQNASYYYNHTRKFIYNFDEKQPNVVHRVLAILEKRKIIRSVITQNIDLLHQKAGSISVREIHGTPSVHRCLTCGKTYCFNEVREKLKKEKVPLCDHCLGVLKPDITFYGERRPENALRNAVYAAKTCDCMMVLGSSLLVYPAASLPEMATANGARLIIVNRQPTYLDAKAELRYDDLKDVFEHIEAQL